MEEDVIELLLKVEPDKKGVRTRWYRNPDGPKGVKEIQRLRRVNTELVEVLREGVRSLTDDQPAIIDTVWCATQPCETLHDYFLAAIAKATGGE